MLVVLDTTIAQVLKMYIVKNIFMCMTATLLMPCLHLNLYSIFIQTIT